MAETAPGRGTFLTTPVEGRKRLSAQGGVLLVVIAGQRARHGTLLKDASTSTVISGPLCGLLKVRDLDTIRPLQFRPRIGPPYKPEKILSERCALSKSPMPSASIIMKCKQGHGGLFPKAA
jgi:hypothetical protein